jgi:hypothetical protein
MEDNGELNIAYQRLARRAYKLEYLLLIRAPKPLLEGAEEMVNKARALVDTLGTYDSNILKKYIESVIIREYSANTKAASCFNCMTGDKYVLETGRYCPKIPVSESESDSPMPAILGFPFPQDADKDCDQYVRVSFTGDINADLLPEILSALQRKYGIDKDLIYRHI